jgi:type II secretion system protein N
MLPRFVREHASKFAYAAIGVALFFAFLLASFPYADTISGILAPTGLRLSSRGQGMTFPYGLRMDGVTLDSPADGRQFFQSDSLRVTPGLLSWLMGSPGVRINADAYGGNFDLRARRAGVGTQVSFNGVDLHLDAYTALRAMGVNLGGIVSGTGDAYLAPNDIFADRGTINLTASSASYRMFAGTPPLKFGDITAIVRLDQGKITIQQLESHGGDVTLSGRGVIQLEPNLPDSEVAIKFQLATTPTGRKRLGFIMNFLPHPPNSTPYFLSGTRAFPSLT